MIPFHYVTFDSADEPMGEPEFILNKFNLEAAINGRFKILELKEMFSV